MHYFQEEEEVRRETQQRIAFFDRFPKFFHKNIQRLRRNLLSYLKKRGVFDEDLFLKYLQNPISNEESLNTKY